MSDIPSDWRDRLNVQEQLSRIDRQQIEIEKLFKERDKLEAERHKYDREPWILIAAALLGALGVLFANLPSILRAIGEMMR